MIGVKLPHIRDQLYAGESKAGSMYSYDLILDFKNERDVMNPQILKKVEILEKEIQRLNNLYRRAV